MLKIGMIVFPKGLIAAQLYRIADIQGRHADLAPMSLGAVGTKMPLSDLRRYRIRATDEVTLDDALVTVRALANPRADDYFRYTVEDAEGDTREAPEQHLTVHEGSLGADPAEMLANFDASPWDLVSARVALLESFFATTHRSMGIVGYNGARMLPIPHQINAARYALQFGRLRFLLADEVGLGKTVEAGLIVSTLRKYFPKWRTAVFVPESLTAQWAFEMYGKFGKLIFNLADDELPEEDEAGVILPHDNLVDFADLMTPEIVVVDEAHRILSDPHKVSSLLELSQSAKAVLLLTATPVSDDSRNLLRLLQVLDPEHFEALRTPEQLQFLQDRQGRIEELLRLIRAKKPDRAAILKAWQAVGIDDADILEQIKSAAGDREGRHALHRVATEIVDSYYPGARILRYRRKFLAQDNELPLRVVDTLEFKPTEEELACGAAAAKWLGLLHAAGLSEDPSAQRTAAALIQAAGSSPLAVQAWIEARRGEQEHRDGVTADPVRLARHAFERLVRLDGEDDALDAMEDAATKWARAVRALDATGRPLARTPRYQALLKFLKESFEEDPDAHILVFTSFEANAHPLWLLLRKALADIAEVYEMCGLQPRIEREKNAFEFQDFPSGSVLVSDDLGGEGRNFQFASHVVHFDLPPAPWMVEQRIGRCDRVGREPELDVHSMVLAAKGQLDEALFDFLADGVGVFNESIAPVEAELDRIFQRVLARCIAEGPTGVLDEIDDVRDALEQAREREYGELLLRSAVGVEEARRIAQDLNDDTELEELREHAIRYARLFDSMVDERDGGRVAITVGEYHSLHGSPGVRGEMVGYFDRREAVRHERLDFFSPGHPFIRAMALSAMADSPDRTAFVRRSDIEESAILCVFRIRMPEEFFTLVRSLDDEMQPPLLSKSAALFGTRMLRVAVTPDGTPIPRDADNEAYYELANPGDESLHEGGDVVAALGSGWADRVDAAVDAALEIAEDAAGDLVEERRHAFEDVLSEVLARAGEAWETTEARIAEIMEALSPLAVELDAAAVLLPWEGE